MSFGPEHESRRPARGSASTDAVTFAWADPQRGWYGAARLGLAAGGASALVVLMHGREPVEVLAEGGIEVAPDADWADLEAAGLRATVEVPLERWRVALGGRGHQIDLVFEATSAPGPSAAVAGGEGYDQLCRVRGTLGHGDRRVEIDGLGQRGHAWGEVDWSAVELTRSVSAWFGEGPVGGVTLASARQAGASGHAGEDLRALLVEGGESLVVADPRLSTTYDGDGHVRRAGLELWVTEDGYPYRAAARVLCGTTLDLGALSLDLAFMHWTAEGREGVGRYEIWRRRG